MGVHTIKVLQRDLHPRYINVPKRLARYFKIAVISTRIGIEIGAQFQSGIGSKNQSEILGLKFLPFFCPIKYEFQDVRD